MITLELTDEQYEHLKNVLVWAELYYLHAGLLNNMPVMDAIDAAVKYRPTESPS